MLTRDEEQLDANATASVDIPRLAQRLAGIRRWIGTQPGIRHLPVGYFASSTGAAIAITAAAKQPDSVAAIVARGGRTDLADTMIDAVQAPTLLIVGGDDVPLLRINRHGYERLRCVKDVQVIHGATHLFEEPGALEEVARLSSDWFTKYLRRLPEREKAADGSTP
jgi:pimeloyl-ACP methyl ester carboxylesterase